MSYELGSDTIFTIALGVRFTSTVGLVTSDISTSPATTNDSKQTRIPGDWEEIKDLSALTLTVADI